MSKFKSYQEKLQIVQEYLEGNLGYRRLASKHGVNDSQIRVWVNQYRQLGKSGLKQGLSRRQYTGDFKLKVLKYRKIQSLSYRETANVFQIPNPSIIANWQRIFLEEGIAGLSRSMGRPPQMKEQPTNNQPLNETEREELERLRLEVELLKIEQEYQKKYRALLRKNRLKLKKKYD